MPCRNEQHKLILAGLFNGSDVAQWPRFDHPKGRNLMEYVLYAILGLVSVIAIIILIALLKPSEFHIARSLAVKASAEKLFPYIDDLKMFQEWSPYKDKDPAAKNEFSGAESGPGATFKWSGNSNVGEGVMKITGHNLNSDVTVDLQFIKPFPGHNTVKFTLESKGDETNVTWGMTGRFALIPKIAGLFINMDRMIGGDFAAGLVRLKSLAETGKLPSAK